MCDILISQPIDILTCAYPRLSAYNAMKASLVSGDNV